jgi:hypothetical protein
MRPMTTAATDALSAGVVQPFFMVAIAYVSGTYYAWTGYNTIAWNGQDWQGKGDFIGVSALTQTSELTAEGATVQFSGLDADDVSSVIGEVQQGAALDIYFGMMSGGSIIVDPVHCFSGHIDVPTLQDDGETSTISISAENELIILSRASMRRYTQGDQAINFPLDTGFQFVPIVQQWSVNGGTWGGKNSGNTVSGNFF